MSVDKAKAIKFVSVLGGLLGAAVCILMALLTDAALLTQILWLSLAAVCLLLIYPLYQIGAVAETAVAQEEKLRLLAARQMKIGKAADVARFSPLAKTPGARTPTGTASVSIPNAAEKTVHYHAAEESAAPQSKTTDSTVLYESAKPVGDLTREFNQQEAERGTLNAETGEINIKNLENANPAEAPSTVIANPIGTYEVNRKYKAVTRFVPLVSIQSIAAGGLHSAAVCRTGYVVATGYNAYGQCNVTAWRDIVSIVAGTHHTIGLKANGTCVATGYTGYGQCDIDNWTGICAIATGTSHTVGLRENGTCVSVGDNTYGQCNVSDWTDIISITANTNYTVGLRVDGTIIAVGANTDGQWGAIKWGSIVAVSAGGLHTVGLRNDGTCVSVGNNANGQCEVSRWTKVKAVSTGNFHTVALREDGTCVACGHNGYGQCNVSEWRNIIAVSAGRNHTLALDRDGRVFAAGDNTYGQSNVKEFTGIRVTGI